MPLCLSHIFITTGHHLHPPPPQSIPSPTSPTLDRHKCCWRDLRWLVNDVTCTPDRQCRCRRRLVPYLSRRSLVRRRLLMNPLLETSGDFSGSIEARYSVVS
ncbi:hypothetical protein Vadar_002103 [Vaccinium darrowii]|uniref:Uncharacterized protein n=1 Tax=Vaccinium darrowii TaxID=229202 RepID=A0ACB7XMK8_9ERIC|nr:hypothetical protein Vadar_002103 [Vaccinium darrowii]